MLELDGLKYSKHEFEDYKFRAIAIFKSKNGSHRRIDIYTTNENKENFITFLIDRVKDGVVFLRLDNWTSKEEDDLQSELLDELLKDL